ncbi:Mediator of RNA polymerase II transcription subunit 7 [Mortierella hygrophila]|uniref:Mediator of RNA polymerase II transcription subunit 7 n=1 Tax=Mortierella hygrophila TaxID=979708 RepID=A0A9P6F895_9FUNG|nr:Mediator of RNA polymerase II transcription subunit 7 [Mortierella hygrophila]
MEDPNAQQQGAAFPAPPYYFQRYTQPNLALLEKAKTDPTNPDLTTALDALPFPIFALEPPPPIKRGICWMFGRPWPVQDTLATLAEQGIEQLYPKGDIDRVKELKKLNHSAIFNFLDLVHVLSTSPGEFATKVDHIRVIFINMHHILNEYRPHQARETLRLMMNDQLDRKRKETAAVRKTCADLRKQLAGLRALEQDRLVTPAGATASDNNQDVDMAPATPAAASTSATAIDAGENGTAIGGSTSATNKNSEAMSRMMQLCDTIE